jgi:gas vesicle protein
MTRSDSARGGTSFSLGMVTGAVVGTAIGAGLIMWLAPRTRSEIRQRFDASADTLGQRASERYQQAASRVTGAVGDLATKGQAVGNDLADVVARGANEVARLATTVKNSRLGGTS